MKKILVYGLATLFLIGCAVTPKSQLELENVVFIDTDTFDKDLSSSMAADTKAITVTMLAPMSINQMPTRLGKWLSAISDKDGRVDVEPKPTTTKSLSLMLGLLPMAYNYLKEEFSYNSASNYNATIFYNQKLGTVKKIVFTKKGNG